MISLSLWQQQDSHGTPRWWLLERAFEVSQLAFRPTAATGAQQKRSRRAMATTVAMTCGKTYCRRRTRRVREVVNVLKPLLLLHETGRSSGDTGLQGIGYRLSTRLRCTFPGLANVSRKGLIEGPVYEWLHICCEKALSKLDRYFKLAHKSPVYYTANGHGPLPWSMHSSSRGDHTSR